VQGVYAGESSSSTHKGWVSVAQGNGGVRITIEINLAVSVTMSPTAARRLATMLRRQATRHEQRIQAAKGDST